MNQPENMRERVDPVSIVSLAIGITSLAAVIVTGFYGAYFASFVSIVILFVVWMGWVTVRILAIEKVIDSARLSSHFAPNESTRVDPAPEQIFFEPDKTLVDSLKKKIKFQPKFLEQPQFTLLFWVNITEDFFESENNRYLFSYTTNPDDTLGYPNAFYLQKQGGSMSWRLMVKGSEPQNQTEFLFSTNAALRGWKLFSVRWNEAERTLYFDIDAGSVHSVARRIGQVGWPANVPNNLFHFGGWLDNWPGGLAKLEFYKFRVYYTIVDDATLRRVFEEEKKVVSRF